MEVKLLDSSFELLDMVDAFDSLVWTDRYLGEGEFQLKVPFPPFKESFALGNYLYNKDSDKLMIIEKIEIDSDIEAGSFIILSGRSLESILSRRVIWSQTTLTGNFQNGIKKLLDANVISPSNADRKIGNFVFVTSTDPAITSLTIDATYFGENLYDAIYELCEAKELGFKVSLNFETKNFEFSLYSGIDRSYGQETLPWVVFSPTYDNFINSNYYKTNENFATVALVSREQDNKYYTREVIGEKKSGLERREIHVASGISGYVAEGEPTPNYDSEMKQKGEEALAEAKVIETVDGELDATNQFIFGKDFFMGDIIQVINEYGMEFRSRVCELVFTHDGNGEKTIPTFIAVNNKED